MARIRTIKPEFFTSEDIVSLTPLARLLYVGLWCEADREGRLNWKPRTLKMKYLPADNCDVMSLCDELVSANLVVPYICDDKPYAVLPSFRKHQAINVREAQSVIPQPPDEVHVHAREKDAWAVDADARETVLARDACKCVRCGSKEHLQIDHIFPKSMGGTNAITNLRVLCRSCNAGRPVSGQALIDDLAKDGLSLADMQRTCMHVQSDGEGKGKEGNGKEGEGNAEANASGARAPSKSTEDLTKDELWSAGKSLLTQAGMPPKQCGSFVGKLVKDYTDAVVIDAVRAAVVARPADPAEYLKAACMRMAGQRQSRPLKPSQMTDAERNSIAATEAEKAKRLLFGDSENPEFVVLEPVGIDHETE